MRGTGVFLPAIHPRRWRHIIGQTSSSQPLRKRFAVAIFPPHHCLRRQSPRPSCGRVRLLALTSFRIRWVFRKAQHRQARLSTFFTFSVPLALAYAMRPQLRKHAGRHGNAPLPPLASAVPFCNPDHLSTRRGGAHRGPVTKITCAPQSSPAARAIAGACRPDDRFANIAQGSIVHSSGRGHQNTPASAGAVRSFASIAERSRRFGHSARANSAGHNPSLGPTTLMPCTRKSARLRCVQG